MRVIKQKDELRRIQKELTPKLVKQVYKLLEKKRPEKIVILIECFIGLLRNSSEVESADVELYLKNHEAFINKL